MESVAYSKVLMMKCHNRRDVELVDYKGEDRDKHGTSIVVEQRTGTSLGLHKRLQGWAIEFRKDNCQNLYIINFHENFP